MKTNEVEKLTGLSKQTIIYYEKEGLVIPSRDQNDYRNFSDEDIQVLQLIKLLRSMNISVDDIKLVINGQLSFQDCLQTQSDFIEDSINELNNVKKTVKYFKEKQIPIIAALSEIEDVTISTKLGYQKSTNTVSLGRVLTKKLLFKHLKILAALAIPIGICMTVILPKPPSFLIIILFIIIVFIIELIFMLAGLGRIKDSPNATAYQNNPLYFIEFIEEGIRYYPRGSILKQLKYFIAILLNKNSYDYLTYYSYENIAKAIITSKIRYISTFGNPMAIDMMTYDFTLEFDDSNRYYLYNSITLDGDLKRIAHILKNKVANIEDRDDVLDKIINN